MNQVYSEIQNHIGDLKRYAHALTRNPTAAEDLVQEALARALSKSHLFRPGTDLRAWLFTILHNQHISDMRRRGANATTVDPDLLAQILSCRPDQDHGLILRAVEGALERLPEKQRSLINLMALDEMTYHQAAERTGLKVGTVKSRISRGRAKLRTALEGRSSKRRRRADLAEAHRLGCPAFR